MKSAENSFIVLGTVSKSFEKRINLEILEKRTILENRRPRLTNLRSTFVHLAKSEYFAIVMTRSESWDLKKEVFASDCKNFKELLAEV